MSTTRVKDASFIQQNIEKILLAIGLVILLLSVVLFVVGNPFAVELSGREFEKPREAVDILEFQNEKIKQGLAEDDPLPATTTPDFLEDYTAMLNLEVPPNLRLAGLSQMGLQRSAILPAETTLPRYARPTPPVPTNVQFVVGADVLDTAYDPEIVGQYYTLWGGERETADFTMFIASADFDRWEWSERLSAAPEVRGESQIPRGIWSERFFIAGVFLLREEWDPVNEVWIDRHIVEPLPGQYRFIGSDTQPVTYEQVGLSEQIPQTVITIRENQNQIAQPELPWLLGAVQAVPPGDEELLGDDLDGFDEFGRPLGEDNLGRAERRILELQEDIRRVEEARARREANRPQSSTGTSRPPRGGGFEGGFEGGPGGPGSSTPDRTQATDSYTRQIQRLQDQISDLEPRAAREREERERLARERAEQLEEQRRLEDLYGGSGNQRPRPGTNPYGEEGFGFGTGSNVQIQEGSTIRVYAADPTMQPGRTYRYKLIVSVINPLYGVPGLEPEQLEENHEKIALMPTDEEIEAMPWIGPVEVEPEAHFFFTNRSNRVEVYRRINGIQAKHEFEVSPGDVIGGTAEVMMPGQLNPVEVDMRVGAILVDIEQRTDRAGNSYTTMIYMDQEGNIFERSREADISSPVRRQLEEEMEGFPEFPLRPKDGQQNFDQDFGGPPGGFGDEFGGFPPF